MQAFESLPDGEMKSASPRGSSLGSSSVFLRASSCCSATGATALGELGAGGELVPGGEAGDGSGAGRTRLGAVAFGLRTWLLQWRDRRRRPDAARDLFECGRCSCRQASARGRCARRAAAAVGRPSGPDARAAGAQAASAASRASTNSGPRVMGLLTWVGLPVADVDAFTTALDRRDMIHSGGKAPMIKKRIGGAIPSRRALSRCTGRPPRRAGWSGCCR